MSVIVSWEEEAQGAWTTHYHHLNCRPPEGSLPGGKEELVSWWDSPVSYKGEIYFVSLCLQTLTVLEGKKLLGLTFGWLPPPSLLVLE